MALPKGMPPKTVGEEAVPPAVRERRERIDELDERIVELLNERQTQAREIRALKEAAGLPRYDPVREEELLSRLAVLNDRTGGPLSAEDVRTIYAAILRCSRGKV